MFSTCTKLKYSMFCFRLIDSIRMVASGLIQEMKWHTFGTYCQLYPHVYSKIIESERMNKNNRHLCMAPRWCSHYHIDCDGSSLRKPTSNSIILVVSMKANTNEYHSIRPCNIIRDLDRTWKHFHWINFTVLTVNRYTNLLVNYWFFYWICFLIWYIVISYLTHSESIYFYL